MRDADKQRSKNQCGFQQAAGLVSSAESHAKSPRRVLVFVQQHQSKGLFAPLCLIFDFFTPFI
jgi:hypothetical protein